MKKVLLILVLVSVMFGLTGCYWNDRVESSQVGLQMKDGVSVTSVVGPGRYTDMGWYARMYVMDTSSKTLIWADSDLWTRDKQSVTFAVSVTYARKSDNDNVRALWEKYNVEAKDDAALERLVATRIPRVAKQITTSLTLDEMLGIAEGTKNRESMSNDLFRLLEAELAECGVQLIDVGVNDIGVDTTYAQKLTEKATARIEVELASERTKQLQEQVKQEAAQTQVALEIARRNNQVAEEEAKVYTISPEAYELERLKLLKDVVGESSKIYFVPQGSNLTLYLAGENGAKTTPITIPSN